MEENKYYKGKEIKINKSIITLLEQIDDKRWTVSCNICSKDMEMWPHGTMIAHISSLDKGSLPCGCSKSPKLKEWQNKIKVQRECELRDYTFLGWDGDYKGVLRTPILLFDKLNNTPVTISTICAFLRGTDSLSRVSNKIRSNKTKDDNFYIDLFFKSGAFKEGTVFRHIDGEKDSTGRYTKWEYTCPVCSHDEYVKAGLCSGIFKSYYEGLKNGKLACRCSERQCLSFEQYKYKVSKILEDEGAKFVDWDNTSGIDLQTPQRCKFKWECKHGHLNCTSISNFLKGRRCSNPLCRFSKAAIVNNYGVYEGKEDNDDFLYVIKLYNKDESFIKIGRSFSPKTRINVIRKFYDIEILKLISGKHLKIRDLESGLHTELKNYHYTPKIPFKGSVFECFDILALNDEIVLDILGT